MTTMRCVSGLSTSANTGEAVAEVLAKLQAGFVNEPADLIVAFASPGHAEGLGPLADELAARSLAKHVLATTGESIVGDGLEVEGSPCLSALAISLPSGSSIQPFRLTFEGDRVAGWPESETAGDVPKNGLVLLLADPFSFPTEAWIEALKAAGAGIVAVGGMASGGTAPGSNRLVLDGEVYKQGAVGFRIETPGRIEVLVSQGCRPIGRPMIVTKAEGNIVAELGRRPAAEVFREIYELLDDRDRRLVQGGLFLGRVVNEYQESFQRGDFLVRNVLGAVDSGGLAVSDTVRVGRTVQFHVRDAQTADEDLRAMLDGVEGRPAGALIFTCNGRGRRLFEAPDHDASAIQSAFGPTPAAGFFAMGEIGPVGGQTFLHGFTVVNALFMS